MHGFTLLSRSKMKTFLIGLQNLGNPRVRKQTETRSMIAALFPLELGFSLFQEGCYPFFFILGNAELGKGFIFNIQPLL